MSRIPLTFPSFSKIEIDAVNDLLHNPQKIAAEFYSKQCNSILKNIYQRDVLVTHSCTGALEMCALLLNIQPGDEVILPSFSFVSTANAFTLFGAKPVFVDVEPDTLNLDPSNLAAAITPRTKAIVVMHYAAVSCKMESIQRFAQAHNIAVIEDAAQCIGASYNNQPLGTFSKLAAMSFHHTKNLTAGLGGALIVNDEELLGRAKIIWQKGTNREAFLSGYIDKYTWHDVGSSYSINELGAALLFGQLNRLTEITSKRLQIWNAYHSAFESLEREGDFKRPHIPAACQHNGHSYFLIADTELLANRMRNHLVEKGISVSSHYVPLHLTPAGRRFSKEKKQLPVCEKIYKRIIRLPIWGGVENYQEEIIDSFLEFTSSLRECE